MKELEEIIEIFALPPNNYNYSMVSGFYSEDDNLVILEDKMFSVRNFQEGDLIKIKRTNEFFLIWTVWRENNYIKLILEPVPESHWVKKLIKFVGGK